MLEKLKSGLKKNTGLNIASHRLYYSFLRTRDRVRNDEKVKDASRKLYTTGVYSKTALHSEPADPGAALDKMKRTWAFNAANTFTGNPKWLFVYINRYHKEIDAYWICDSEKTVDFVRSLGYKAYTFGSVAGIAMQKKTGVFCVEQVKEKIPSAMPADVILLNLYHGVGCKTVEKQVDYGFLAERIAQKYIANNEYYMSHMLFLVTSPLMEKHFIKQIGLREENLIRAGYPRCLYQQYYEPVKTFDHDFLKKKGLPEDTVVAAYVPTYRDSEEAAFWSEAIPDMDRLIARLEELNMMMIFKLHPQMLRDPAFRRIKERYRGEKRLLFWDNARDFYEVFDRIDIGIIDYSSIFYDMLAGGVRHFVRYFYDYDRLEENLRGFVFDLEEMTCGELCTDFEKMLLALETCRENDTAERDRIMDLFWQYSGPDSMEQIIRSTMDFVPLKESGCPTLYSFDVFDTLIGRRVLDPAGIFYAVQYKMAHSGEAFDEYLQKAYPQIRMWCEGNAREYYARTLLMRKTDHREISFEMIFDRMAELYPLTQAQKQQLMAWELEAEYENCIPYTEYLGKLERLVARGERVWLISDMYLPEEFVRKLLNKVSPIAASLPLYLSSTWGVQKSKHLLYLKAYLLQEDWPYARWIHYGDNPQADGQKAAEMGIVPRLHAIPEMNAYEQALVEQVNTYDAFLVAALFARFRFANPSPKAYFAYAYTSLYFVPYVYDSVHHALEQGVSTIYFISRDGHQLKRIADTVIKTEGLSIKTRYIYGSRKAWRIPSFIEDVDEDFFAEYGNLSGVNSYQKLLDALLLTDEDFVSFFPTLDTYRGRKNIYKDERDEIAKVLRENRAYRDYILEIARKQREPINRYLKQEIDFSEKFAFIEYWGRGYTQTCFTRLLQDAAGDPQLDDVFYYARSIYPTMGHDIRINYSSCFAPMIFAEALFASIPYKSVTSYRETPEGRIEPVIEPSVYDRGLFEAMEDYLPAFTESYALLPALDKKHLGRSLHDFGLSYLEAHNDDPFIAEQFGSLIDEVTVSGGIREYAPKVDRKMINQMYGGVGRKALTSSPVMSMARSAPKDAKKFNELKIELPEIQKNEAGYRLGRALEKEQRLQKMKQARQALAGYEAIAAALQERYEKLCRKHEVLPLLVCLNCADHRMVERFSKIMVKKGMVEETKRLTLGEHGVEDEKLMLIAEAAYLLTDAPLPLLSALKLRAQTKLLLLPASAFEGMTGEAADAYYDEKKLALYINKNPFYAAAAAGPAHAQQLRERFPLLKNVVPCGLPVMDCWFDKRFVEEARAALQEAFPEAGARRVICCLPGLQDREGRYAPDMGMMAEKLADSCVLITGSDTEGSDEPALIPECCAGFGRDLTGKLTKRQMMACADVLLGSDPILYEGVLTGKPIFRIGEGKDAAEPVYYVRDTVALCGRLRDKLPDGPLPAAGAFKDKYLSYCTGRACAAFTSRLKKDRRA